jgi:ethanolamine utilization protein EutN
MILGRIVGDVWSTKKNEKIHALRLLFVQPLGRDLLPSGQILIAADEIGAGVGDMVIVTQGAPAMQAFERDKPVPVDAVVLGIVDSLDMAEDEDNAQGGT